MAEQLADNEQAVASGRSHAGEGMAQIIQANVRQFGPAAKLLPDFLQSHEVRALLSAREHIRIVVNARQAVQQLNGWRAQRNGFLTCLGVGQAEAPVFPRSCRDSWTTLLR